MLKHSKKTFVNKYFLSFKKRSTTKQQNMKNNRIAVTFLVVMLCAGLASTGQNTLKLRVSGNSSRFISEPQGSEVSFREVDSLNQTLGILKDFTHKGELGAEVEMMLSLSEKAWFGLEIGNSRMSGTSGNPGFSNFQFSNLLQLQATDTTAAIPVSVHYRTSYPLEYKTTLFNILGNLRFYPAPDGKFRPFVKATAGVSLVSTELALSSPTLWYDELPAGQVAGPPVLFSQGTPESEKGKFPAFTFGGGIGFEYQITEKRETQHGLHRGFRKTAPFQYQHQHQQVKFRNRLYPQRRHRIAWRRFYHQKRGCNQRGKDFPPSSFL